MKRFNSDIEISYYKNKKVHMEKFIFSHMYLKYYPKMTHAVFWQ